MTSIESVIIEVSDLAASASCYADAVGLGGQVRLRAADEPTSGFRGCTLSLTVSQPAPVSGFIDAALAAGATALRFAWEPRTGLNRLPRTY